jgi:hypothetical protein
MQEGGFECNVESRMAAITMSSEESGASKEIFFGVRYIYSLVLLVLKCCPGDKLYPSSPPF